MKKGILFDLDGTLWDSSQTVIDSWNECLALKTDLNRTYTVEQMKSYMGKTLDKIGDMMMPDLPPSERLRIMHLLADYERVYLKSHGSNYFRNEEAVIRGLAAEYFLGIVSNCQDGYIQIFIEQCGFGECFSDFECSSTGLDKAGNIGLVAQRNSLDRIIYVGDTVLDGEAARKAGVPFVHAGYGFGSPDDFDLRISSIEELPAAAKQLLQN
ncbi:MAG: HAD family hydrolase [Ruminiclostridium sp.]|nr:HAD family hydrolase [Ruminiclostridium sp.]